MDSLRNWLNGTRDYSSGVKLYQELGADPLLKRMFAESESDFKRKKLVKALEDLWVSSKSKKGFAVSSARSIIFTSVGPGPQLPSQVITLAKSLQRLEQTLEEKQEVIEELEWEKQDLKGTQRTREPVKLSQL